MFLLFLKKKTTNAISLIFFLQDMGKENQKSADKISGEKDSGQIKYEEKLTIPRNSSFEVPKSPNSLKSALKVEANRKFSVPAKLSSDNSGNPLDEWFSAQER